MTLFTDRSVYGPLADKLPQLRPRYIDVARYSKAGEGGVAGQRSAHFSRYAEDPDIQELRRIPEAAWDPKQPEVGALHRITWISLCDLHPSLDGRNSFAAVTWRGETVFASVELSAVTAHIQRDDGSEDNGYTWLVTSLLNHYRKADAIRWADDLKRAGRTEVSWAQIKEKCLDYDILMTFGGKAFDLSEKSDKISLDILSAFTSSDNKERQEMLTGKRVAKLDQGGGAVAEHGLPRAWKQARDRWGRPITDGRKGAVVPEGDAAMIPVMQALYTRHAAGDSYQDLWRVVVGFEEEGLVTRRDHSNPDNTYAAASTAVSRDDAIRPFFAISKSKPATPPTEEAIARYLDGEDPADVFDRDTRIYLSRVEHIRTGRYFRRLRNDMKGITAKGVNGYKPELRDELDVKGAFYVLSEPWPWPVDEAGNEVPSFGIDDQTCRQVGARLLRELIAARETGGGRPRRDGLRRVFQEFAPWRTEPGDPVSVYGSEPTAWGVRGRTHRGGKNTFCVMHRPASEDNGGWSYLPDAGSGSLAELCASVARDCDARVTALLEEHTPVTLNAVRHLGDDPTIAWRDRLSRREKEQKESEDEETGFNRLAARAEAVDDVAKRDECLRLALNAAERVAALKLEIVDLERQLEDHRQLGSDHDAEGDVSILAYVVVALEKAATNHGLADERVGKLCDRTFTDWRFVPDGEHLHWSCVSRIPVTSGQTVELPLSGTIRNLRTETGRKKRRLAGAARYVFGEGRNVDEVAEFVGCNRRSLYLYYLMPWLRDNGVTSPGLKCAAVDHPVPLVRTILWRVATGESLLDIPESPAYLDRVASTYRDPDGSWGNTAVPDDTVWIQRALNILTANEDVAREGMTLQELALRLGKSEWNVRQLVTPRARKAGFKRPRYLEYADAAKTRMRPYTCPHDGAPADFVSLLPEVAASGVGVLCRSCRRVPVDDAIWSATLFPAGYVAELWTKNPAKASIMDLAGTVTVSGLDARVIDATADAQPSV